MSLVGSIVTSGTGCDPSPEGRKLEALGEVPEGEPVGSKLLLQCRTVYAGLDAGGAGDIIYLQDSVEDFFQMLSTYDIFNFPNLLFFFRDLFSNLRFFCQPTYDFY